MSIHSDVDLLVLSIEGAAHALCGVDRRALQYWMWDAGLTVGCATRTIEETRSRSASRHVTVRTAVLTARFLCGDGEFFHEFADAIRRELLPDVALVHRGAVRTPCEERHERYGESALPAAAEHVKEGAGGLRDYHTAYWVACARAQPSARDLDDFLHFGLLTDFEMRDYHATPSTSCGDVRNELHLRGAALCHMTR